MKYSILPILILSLILSSCSKNDKVITSQEDFLLGKTFLTPAGVTKEECEQIKQQGVFYNCFRSMFLSKNGEKKEVNLIFTDIPAAFDQYTFENDTLKINTKNSTSDIVLENPIIFVLNKNKDVFTRISSNNERWALDQEGKDIWEYFK
ncbi:Probable lipoprotein precursor [Tenacibaculum maritimum]|uniref:hypothetical protein n=1 Tax=Tenacibaculum maritimum TaxID=107401 RepID=UPI0012E644DE|nr:hypothetical protein [Tenacibaculum maritimum]CAA0192792.1 Probable lipoprotein precursor [Tenacibaculum maritimum]CAA0229104.1 Probable lipoprotein precursor [Tenacibaculum maritimum]